jgi:hypothetical protein
MKFVYTQHPRYRKMNRRRDADIVQIRDIERGKVFTAVVPWRRKSRPIRIRIGGRTYLFLEDRKYELPEVEIIDLAGKYCVMRFEKTRRMHGGMVHLYLGKPCAFGNIGVIQRDLWKATTRLFYKNRSYAVRKLFPVWTFPFFLLLIPPLVVLALIDSLVSIFGKSNSPLTTLLKMELPVENLEEQETIDFCLLYMIFNVQRYGYDSDYDDRLTAYGK